MPAVTIAVCSVAKFVYIRNYKRVRANKRLFQLSTRGDKISFTAQAHNCTLQTGIIWIYLSTANYVEILRIHERSCVLSAIVSNGTRPGKSKFNWIVPYQYMQWLPNHTAPFEKRRRRALGIVSCHAVNENHAFRRKECAFTFKRWYTKQPTTPLGYLSIRIVVFDIFLPIWRVWKHNLIPGSVVYLIYTRCYDENLKIYPFSAHGFTMQCKMMAFI